MGMAAVLVMWPGRFKQTLASICQVVSEEKMFENVDILTHIWTTEVYLYYKLTSEPSTQVS